MVTTITDLLNRANIIMNETEPDANTEERIGSLFRDMTDTLSADSGTGKVTLADPSADNSEPQAVSQPVDVTAWRQMVWDKLLYLFRVKFSPQSMQALKFYGDNQPADSEVSSEGGDLWYDTSDGTLYFAEWSGIDLDYVNWIPQDLYSTVLYIYGTDVLYYTGSSLVRIASLLPALPEGADSTGVFLRGDGQWADTQPYIQPLLTVSPVSKARFTGRWLGDKTAFNQQKAVETQKITFTLDNFSDFQGKDLQLVMKQYFGSMNLPPYSRGASGQQRGFFELNSIIFSNDTPSRFPFTAASITPDLQLEKHFKIDSSSQIGNAPFARRISNKRQNNYKMNTVKQKCWNYFTFHIMADGIISPELARIKAVVTGKMEADLTEDSYAINTMTV